MATNVWAGGNTSTRVKVAARLTAGVARTVRLAVSTSEAMTAPVYSAPVVSEVAKNHILQLTVEALSPDTHYWYDLEVDGSLLGAPRRTRTMPTPGVPTSYVFGTATCHARGMVPGPICDDIYDADLMLFMHGGDWHYENETGTDPLVHAAHIFNLLDQQAGWQKAWGGTPMMYVPDDHDSAVADVLGAALTPGLLPSREGFRMATPTYDLPTTNLGAYQAVALGRVWHIMLDAKFQMDPVSAPQSPTKTMLGAEQKAWLKSTLIAARDAGAAMIVLSTSVAWIWGGNMRPSSSWRNYQHEQREIADFIRDNHLEHLLFIVHGDNHNQSYDTGEHSDFSTYGWRAPVPVLCSAPLTQVLQFVDGYTIVNPADPPANAPYSWGPWGGTRTWAKVIVSDPGVGAPVTVTVEQYDFNEATGDKTLLATHTFERGIAPDPPTPATPSRSVEARISYREPPNGSRRKARLMQRVSPTESIPVKLKQARE